MGGSTIINNKKNEVKKYLLGQLEEADQERLELRLLTDPAFNEEFDTIVDELTDEYVGNEIQGDERKRVEQYFLTSAERQKKVKFAEELLERAEVERGEHSAASEVQPVVAPSRGILERLRLFWENQSFSLRVVTAVASLIIVVGVVLQIVPPNRTSGTYALLNLTIGSTDRSSEGSQIQSVRLEQGSPGIRITLSLPEQVPQATSYRVELLDGQQSARNLSITERTAHSLIVTIPANELKRGSYIIRLYGNEQRIPGSYFFNVE